MPLSYRVPPDHSACLLLRRTTLYAASVRITAGPAANATTQPVSEGGECPNTLAMGGTNRKPAAIASSINTAPTKRRFENHPSEPGHRVVLRHANPFAIWPMTTAANVAPERGLLRSPQAPSSGQVPKGAEGHIPTLPSVATGSDPSLPFWE